MVREIRFRGKSKETGEWKEGSLLRFMEDTLDSNEIFYAIVNSYLATTSHIAECRIDIIDPLTLGQFIGMEDKNGVNIFEGDIVEDFGIGVKNHHIKAVIKYRGNCFGMDSIDNGIWYPVVKGGIFCPEVIGNIYDNPELLTPSIQ